MELWDTYNQNREKQNKIIERGDRLESEEFHLVVHIWIVNNKGELLISQRCPNKSHPGMWEATGGSVLAGEDSLQAAVREVKEEIGLELNKKDGILLDSKVRRFKDKNSDICDVWLFKSNVAIEKLVLQEEEVSDVKWVSKNELKLMIDNGKFLKTVIGIEEAIQGKFLEIVSKNNKIAKGQNL